MAELSYLAQFQLLLIIKNLIFIFNMKAYSLDLRKKIIETYLNQNNSIRQLAARFQVPKSFVQKLIKRYKESGRIEAKSYSPGPAHKLKGFEQLIRKLVQEKPDATLKELCFPLQVETGINVSISTLCVELKKLNLTGKKNFSHNSSRNHKKFGKKT